MKFGLIITFCLSLTAFFLPEESNSQSISGTVNKYFKVTYYKAAYNGLRVQGVTGLNVGDRVMIIQMKGATISTINNSTFGNITNSPSMNGAGLYEMATIAAFINDTLLFKSILVNTYDFTQSVQLVYVPTYTDVTVSGTLTASPWDSTSGTGGIIAIEATGTITLNANIDASGAGFKGGVLTNSTNCSSFASSSYSYSLPSSQNSFLTGAYKGEGINRTGLTYNAGKGKQSNGGGGGNNHNTGGGGGGNYEAGGRGGIQNTSPCNGSNYGIGGAALKTYGYSLTNNRLFLGGGGGAGHENNNQGTPGGNGGGIIYIKCDNLIGNGNTIRANGLQGYNTFLESYEGNGDGGGGGGAGGNVLLNVASFTTSLFTEAKGADGSKVGFMDQCPGPGGGGGGGVVWSKAVLPANVTSSAAGGASGIVKITGDNSTCRGLPNGATPGLNGIVQPGFIPVEGGVKFESAILKSVNITEWNGKRLNNTVELKWKVEDASSVAEIRLEKKTAQGSFKTIKLYSSIVDGYQVYTDQSNEFPAIYRLKLLSKSGKTEYTNQLFFDRLKVQHLNIYPNPVADNLNIQLPGSTTGKVSISVFDFTGKQVMQKEMVLSGSQSTISLKLTSLSAGMYTIQLNKNEELFIGKIIKQ